MKTYRQEQEEYELMIALLGVFVLMVFSAGVIAIVYYILKWIVRFL